MQAIKNSPIMDIKNTINKILGDNYLTIKDDVIISWDRLEGMDISIRDNKATGDYEVRGIPDESSINGLIESGTVVFDDETYEFTAQNIIQKVSDDVPSYFHSKRLRIDNTSDKRELREIFSPSRLKFFEEAEEGADVWEQSCTLE